MSELPQLLVPETTAQLQTLRSSVIQKQHAENAPQFDRYIWEFEDRFFVFAHPRVRARMISAAMQGVLCQHWLGSVEFYVDRNLLAEFTRALAMLIDEIVELAHTVFFSAYFIKSY